MSRIGEKIKHARLEQKIPLKQLGKMCGVSESYLNEIESGKRVINDSMIIKISGILKIDLNEQAYSSADEDENTEVKLNEPKSQKKITEEWQNAFSSIIKDVPVYNISMDTVLEYKHLPIIDKKVEGYNPEKLIFIKVPDNSQSGFRIKKDDIVLVFLNIEILNNSLCLMEYDSKRVIRHIKRLDGSNVLLLYHQDGIKTETRDYHEIKILGHLIRAEIDLTRC